MTTATKLFSVLILALASMAQAADYVTTFPISTIYSFPVYQTREAYKTATGQEAPAFDASKPLKAWFDPSPKTMPGSLTKVMYTTLLEGVNEKVLAGPDGKPTTDILILSVADAKTVNIAPKGPGILDQPMFGFPVPVPVRALKDNETLVFSGPFAIPEVKLTNVPDPNAPSTGGGFTDADRALLNAIAKKMGISQ